MTITPWDADDVSARHLPAAAEARLIENLAAIRARTANADQFVPGSRAHINATRGNSNA